MSAQVRELLLYAAASGCALLVDVGLLTFMHLVGVHYLIAASASFTSGAFVAYLLCIRWVFTHRRVPTLVPEFGVFWALGVIGLVANTAMMYLGVELLEIHLLLAKATAAGATGVLNYTLRKFILFTSSEIVRSSTDGGTR